ncbi:hypothetical protein [Bradyrhizobium sp. G127]|uniref:hypothetical protein n=1 Tax=Bradyrhizobium sp. G127 TaxID=2904800 RepID=UPI001F19E6AD|nr:hypothetical protein [Bradyrhizobium sp. G127]MCF2525412.1 hypothetical protein [Bradyrhizobium sp. G127]
MTDEEDATAIKIFLKSGKPADALDLLAIERRIAVLERKRTELESKSRLIPGRSAHLRQVRKEIAALGWAEMSAKEQVRANRYQSEIHQKEKERAVSASKLASQEREAFQAFVAARKAEASSDKNAISRESECENEPD